MMTKQQITKFIFQTTNILKIQDFLEQHPDLDPRQLLDTKKNNILHHLSFNDQKQLIKLYINHTSRLVQRRIQISKQLYKKQTKQQISAWVNQKNQEGFTPILYASFNGHVQLIHYLVDIGASIASYNNTKLNVLHMAAQNNKVSSFIYFKDKVDYNITDQKGSTPLHWAAYSGAEQTVGYLLTLPQIKINAKDLDGQTPLILATLYGNTRIVRRLLIKGANRNIKNNQGQLPIQIARQSQYKNIIKMLDEKYNCFDFLKFYYNVKLEYKPKSRNYTLPIVYLITVLTSLLILHGLLEFKRDYFYILEVVIIGMMLFLYATLLLPPKTEEKQNIALYVNETKKICFQCVKRKPRRSYHCDICKVCIEQYDHHCTWINNCVGKKNIARFILFILFLILSLGVIGITAAWGFLKETFIPNFTNQWIDFRQHFQPQTETYKWIKIGLFSINLLISIFVLPVLLLFLVQVKNLLINKTTYERIKGQSQTVRDQLKKKKKRGPSLANCKAMCSKSRQSFSSDQSLQQRILS